MNRVDRLHAILTFLQTKRIVKAEELADHFGISIRTIYRDLRALEEGGIPIGAEAGIGYYLAEGFHLPPVMFTQEEARSLLLAGKFLEKYTDQQVRTTYQNALNKVRAVLDQEKKDDLEGLEQKIMVNPWSSNRPSSEDLQLNQLKQALSQNRVIEIEYQTIKQELSQRQLEPIGLCFYLSQWHLIAYCRLRKDYRDFRLDRILNLKILSETFLRIHHPSLKEYLDKLYKETELIEVKINVSKEALPYMNESKYHQGFIQQKENGEFVEMEFAILSEEYFARWVIIQNGFIEVISPESIKEKVKSVATEICQRYAQP